MKKLILLRALPGAGKSTLAQKIYKESNTLHPIDQVIFSTDNEHMKFIGDKWEYVFQPDKLFYFHKKNQANALNAMGLGKDFVIVDNTNTTFEEMKPYIIGAFIFGYDVEMVEPETAWRYDIEELTKRNAHGVPIEAIRKMKQRFQATSGCMVKCAELMSYLKGVK